MDDSPEFVLKKLCCTCLSQDRKLTQLCRLTEGINNLYLLLSYDSEAYRVRIIQIILVNLFSENFYSDKIMFVKVCNFANFRNVS